MSPAGPTRQPPAPAGVPAGKIRGVGEALRAAETATTSVFHPTAGRLELVAAPFALLRAGGGQLRVHQSKSHRGGLQLSNLNALRSDVRYLANSALPTVIGLNRLGLDGGPLRSPIIHHGSASV